MELRTVSVADLQRLTKDPELIEDLTIHLRSVVDEVFDAEKVATAVLHKVWLHAYHRTGPWSGDAICEYCPLRDKP